MQMPLAELERMPKPVQRADLPTFAGWACCRSASFAFYDPNSFLNFAIAGGLVCRYRYKDKRGARLLAMLSSVLIMLSGGFFAFLFAGHHSIAMSVSVANAVLFGTAFFYLLVPDACRFIKKI